MRNASVRLHATATAPIAVHMVRRNQQKTLQTSNACAVRPHVCDLCYRPSLQVWRRAHQLQPYRMPGITISNVAIS
jgi:hypothetical protein